MPRHVVILAISCLIAGSASNAQEHNNAEPITVAPGDWPWWRGPERNGNTPPNQKPPVKWSATANVRWSAPIPGRGHGSPIVVGDRVFLASADHEREVQSVLCFHRQTGMLLWQTVVHQGG